MSEAGTALTVSGLYQSTYRGGVMDTVIVSKPCVKCGSTDRMKSGKCRSCNKERSRIAYIQNKEKYLLAAKVWAEKNREKSREIKARWVKENPEKMAQCLRNWYERNRDRVSAGRKKWRAANNSHSRTFCINRRRKMAGGKLSKDIVGILMEKQKGKCACCFKPLNGDFHLDHRMPIALGGENIDSNMQLLHSVCNLKKSAKHPVDYMQELGLLL
jgi:5-methylcytosine-specific restriction endonuclease McrA